jgi:NADH:ubiquinone oxidoreductase subunit E
MPKIKLAENTIQLILDICKEFENREGELINVLHRVQSKLGYLPAEVQEVIANGLNCSVAKVWRKPIIFLRSRNSAQLAIKICSSFSILTSMR